MKGAPVGVVKTASTVQVLARAERLDLGLALADQAQRDRLHAAGASAARQLAPEHRREGEAHQVVEGAARQIRLDQRLVELARVLHRVADRGAGDLVEGDPAHVDAPQRPLLVQHGADMPGDRLALAVGVGGEIQGAGTLQRLRDRLDLAVAALVGRPIHGEILLRPHAAVLRRQVADMAEAREHREAVAEIAVDGLGLGGQFDDDDVSHSWSSTALIADQGDAVSGQRLDAAGQLQLEEHRHDGGRRELAMSR